MKLLKILTLSIVGAFVLVVITNQFTTSKYPPCDLVSKGTSVSTYGCSNNAAKNVPCLNFAARSEAQTDCINANYYKYNTFPFGFKQKFGPNSNLNDPKPKQKNELATFVLGFILINAALSYIAYRHKSRANKEQS